MQIMETRKEKQGTKQSTSACTNRLTSASNPYIMKLFFNNPVKTNQTIRIER